MTRTNQRAGFSLLELLVVIAIIAVVIAMLLPSLKGGKAKGRNIQCISNVRQWHSFWTLYANDNSGYFSDGVFRDDRKGSGNIGWNRGQWMTVLEPYWSKNNDVILCPEATEPSKKGGVVRHWGGPNTTYQQGDGTHAQSTGKTGNELRSSYGINNWVYNVPWKWNGVDQIQLQGRAIEWHWRSFGRARYPHRVPLIGDSMWRGGGPHYMIRTRDGRDLGTRNKAHFEPPPDNGVWPSTIRNFYSWEMGHFCFIRHRAGIEDSPTVNFSFFDGSARPVHLKELWRLKWSMKWRPQMRIPGRFQWPEWMKDFPEFDPPERQFW